MRVILVALTGDSDDRTALTAAARLAQRHSAHVAAVFLRPEAVDAISILGEGMSPDLIDQIIRNATEAWDTRRDQAQATYAEIRAELGLAETSAPAEGAQPSLSWQEVTGSPGQLAEEHGRLADLILLPAAVAEEVSEQRQQILEAMMFAAGRPILLATKALTDASPRRIAVAWDGSVEATRAVAGAMPLLRQAETLAVLSSGTDAETKAQGLCRYLRWHGLSAAAETMAEPERDLGAALIGAAKNHRADLLVMGGYGHSRVRELIFGGVTRYVLYHPELPVLFAH